MGFAEVKEKADAIQKAVEESSVIIGANAKGNVPGVSVSTGLPGMESWATDLRKISEELKISIFKILCMGTFKNGKSTAINALIGKELLPVGVTACTAVISQVIYGADSSHVRVFKTGSSTPEVLTWERFNKEYKLSQEDKKLIDQDGKLDRFSDIDYVLLENNSELFRDGVIIIDSPGLEEAVSRTKATENFFPQANAIVLVLNALQLLSGKDRLFILQHFIAPDTKPRNVFFIVNRFNQLNNDQEREEVRQEAMEMLEPVFTVDGVLNRELMNNRVFFVNALGAYEMKKNGQVPVGTGMDEFQNALEKFLTSEDRILARYQSVVANMASVLVDAQRKISETKIAMTKPLAELEKNSAASQKKLDALDKDIKSMATTINRTEDLVKTKILSDLQLFLTVKMPENWKSHAAQYDTKFGITAMIKLALPFVSNARRQAILNPMVTFLNDFVEEQLFDWSNSITLLIAPHLADMQDELGDKSRDFSIKFDEARRIFTGAGSQNQQISGANKLQLILSLIQGDFSSAIENSAGGNFSWGEFVRRYVVQAVINILIVFIIGGGIPALIMLVIASLFKMGINANSTRDRILNAFADNLFPEIAEEMLNPDNREKIIGSIHSQFGTWEEQVTKAARELIQDERNHQQTILANKQKKQSENEREISRQETLLKALSDRTNFVYSTIYNREATPENLKKLAASIETGQKDKKKES